MLKARIDVYSHFFKVSKIHPDFITNVFPRCVKELLQVSFVKIRGRVVKQNGYIYAARTKDATEYRFHINYLDRMKEILKECRINEDVEIEWVHHPLYEPAEIKLEMPKELVLRDYQEEAVGYIQDDGVSKLVTFHTGAGKGFLLTQQVYTPEGWREIGELKIGDKVYTPKGKITEVIEISDNHDQELYEITFIDNRTCITDGHHLWQTCIYNGKDRLFDYKVFSTEKLYKSYLTDIKYTGEVKLTRAIPLVSSDVFDESKEYEGLDLSIKEYQRLQWSKGKVCEIKDDTCKVLDLPVLPIDSISKLDYRSDTRCIAVADPEKLYVVEDYIVTHNTFTALKAGEVIGQRIFITILGRYKAKWVEDVINGYGEDCGVFLAKGVKDIFQLLDAAENGQELPNIIIATTTVMQRYVKEWEENKGANWGGMSPPEELYEKLGIGFRIIDEAHQHFHSVFKNDLYTHCPKCLYLTATLDTFDDFQRFIYRLMWPPETRGNAIEYHPYDETIAVVYSHMNPEKIRCQSQQGYSHVLYEQSLYRHARSWYQYLDMIGDQIEKYFVPIYEPGKKMLIFCSLVETCEQVAHYINERFKDKGWQVSKFTAEDNKEIIDTNDITVSTLGKAGTALDISGLVVCLMTTALSEPKANKQAKGRLRNLTKKPGFEHITPKFIYFVGKDISKHWAYHQNKKFLFRGLTKTMKEDYTNYVIGEEMETYLNQPGKIRRDIAWGKADRKY